MATSMPKKNMLFIYLSDDATDARFGSKLFFIAAIVLPMLFGWKLMELELSANQLLLGLMLVLNTSLVCLLCGLVLPLYAAWKNGPDGDRT